MKNIKIFEEFDLDDPADREMFDLAELVSANHDIKKNWTNNLGVPVTTSMVADIALDIIHEIVQNGYKITKI